MAFTDKWIKTSRPFTLRSINAVQACTAGIVHVKKYVAKNELNPEEDMSDEHFALWFDEVGFVHEKWLLEKGFIATKHVALSIGDKIDIAGEKYTLAWVADREAGLVAKNGNVHGRTLKLKRDAVSKRELQYMLKNVDANTVLR